MGYSWSMNTEISPDIMFTEYLPPISDEVYLILFHFNYGVELKGVFTTKQLAEDAKRDLVYSKHLPYLAEERRKSKIFWKEQEEKLQETQGRFGYPVHIPDHIGNRTDEELEKMANNTFEIIAVKIDILTDIMLYCE